MKITDIINEAVEQAPVNAGQDYQQMMAFVKSNRLQGLPADQQVAVALFKELKRQQQKNAELASELDSAEERIDVATQRSDMYGKQLNRHQIELDRERQDLDKQKTTVGQIDQQIASRTQASQMQMQALTQQLDAIKQKPGVDSKAAAELERQIKQLDQKGVPLEKYRELEQNIAQVQKMQKVDDTAIKDLVGQINKAQAIEKELEKTKQDLSTNLNKNAEQALARIEYLTREIEKFKQAEKLHAEVDNKSEQALAKIDYLTKELAKFKEVDQTVASLRREIDDLETEYDETTATVFDLENDVHRLDTMFAARNQAMNAAQMIRKTPQAAAQTHQAPAVAPVAHKPNVKDIGQRLINKGVLKSLD